MCATSRAAALLFGCMALGSLMIIAMSAWLNASALAGAAAIQQHLAVSVQSYTRDLDRAHANALAAQSLVPDIQMAATRFSKLAEAERGGSLTGTSGSGTVVQLLTQMSTQLGNLAQEVTPIRRQGEDACSSRAASISTRCASSSPTAARSTRAATPSAREAMSLMGVIAALQQTSVAPAVKRAADGLVSGFIAPAAGGRGDLAERQTSVVGKVEQRGGGAGRGAVRRRRQDPGGAARSSPSASSRCRPPKRSCAMPATSCRAGPARSRST